jgi:hypothetical protein
MLNERIGVMRERASVGVERVKKKKKEGKLRKDRQEEW